MAHSSQRRSGCNTCVSFASNAFCAHSGSEPRLAPPQAAAHAPALDDQHAGEDAGRRLQERPELRRDGGLSASADAHASEQIRDAAHGGRAGGGQRGAVAHDRLAPRRGGPARGGGDRRRFQQPRGADTGALRCHEPSLGRRLTPDPLAVRTGGPRPAEPRVPALTYVADQVATLPRARLQHANVPHRAPELRSLRGGHRMNLQIFKPRGSATGVRLPCFKASPPNFAPSPTR